MAEILVTGGTGGLGSRLVPELVAAGHSVRVLTKRPGHVAAGAHAVQGDIVSGAGVDEAVPGIDVLVHAATGNRSLKTGEGSITGVVSASAGRRNDVEPTRALLGRVADDTHVVYISIVGVDRIPLGYYIGKRETEQVIEASGKPFTILRSTQWFNLLDEFFERSVGAFVVVPHGMRAQAMDPDIVAARVAELAVAAPGGHVAPIGGPEVRSMKDFASAWISATGSRKRVLALPLPGKAMRGFKAGHNLAEAYATPGPTYDEWLASAGSRSV